MFASEQDRRDVAWRRSQWKKYQDRLDPRRLVFIDETWAKTNMTRTRGWCLKGMPLKAKVPHGHWKTMTFLAALRHDRIAAPCVFDGPINGERFLAWLRQALVPTLRPGDIVIMDNLSSHKSPAIRKAIRDAGAWLFFLPPYSPDLNPPDLNPISTPLSRSLPNSKHRCAKPMREPLRQHGGGSENSSITSLHKNAQITSGILAMLPYKMERL